MQTILVDDHLRFQFRSTLKTLIHFSFSLTQLASALAVLGLQIALTTTQTCAFQIGIGFWSFPFLLFSPISIWILLWRQRSVHCILAVLIHLCSTLFATAVMIVSFLALIGIIGVSCSASPSSNGNSLLLNSSLIGVAGLFKLVTYGEIFLLYIMLYNTDQTAVLLNQTFPDKYYRFIPNDTNTQMWYSWRSANNDRYHYDDDLHF